MPPQSTPSQAAQEGAMTSLSHIKHLFVLPGPERFIRRSRPESNLVGISTSGSFLAHFEDLGAVNVVVDLADPYDVTLEALMHPE
jgi:hypothetical protein